MRDDMRNYVIPEPGFEKIFRAEILMGNTYPLGDIGKGYSEIVATIGGKFEGRINGEIIPIGGDWGLMYSTEVNEMDNRTLLKTEDGAYISMNCTGRLIMSPEIIDKVMAGEEVSPNEYYFRQNVEFISGDEKYKWLNESVFFASVIITREGNVCLDVYELK